MRVRVEYIGESDARAFARVIALLCLVAHAVLVSATHYHLAPQISKKPSSASLEARQEGDPNRSPDSDSHNDCLSCRLHRNFVSGIHSPAVLIALTSGPLIREMILLDPHSSEPFLISASRAPPSA